MNNEANTTVPPEKEEPDQQQARLDEEVADERMGVEEDWTHSVDTEGFRFNRQRDVEEVGSEEDEEVKDEVEAADRYHFSVPFKRSSSLQNNQRHGRGERRIIGVRLQQSCMVYRVVTPISDLEPGDRLQVQTRDGEAEGRVIFVSDTFYAGKNDPRKPYAGRITRIVRKLENKDDLATVELREKERHAKILGRELIRQDGLSMKLTRVIYQPGGTKAIFCFTSEVRVDFRELVKKLAEKLNVRVEMRHIGVRDETRILGGVGHCGRNFCCSQFLQRFHPVSVRMAKNQDLSLNPEGISGVCGRLMCCLAYENDTYSHLRASLPTPKGSFWTKDGREVTIRSVHPLQGSVEYQCADGSREVCPATALMAIKAAPDQTVAEPVPEDLVPTIEPAEVMVDQEDLTAASPGDSEAVVAAAPGGGEKKRRSRRRRNRKKQAMAAPITEAGHSSRPPSGREEEGAGAMDSVAAPEREETEGSAPGSETGTVRKKRRRKRKKTSINQPDMEG
ncbi:MAG: hypothetical protein HQL73_08860 [Magnetococcales bacterium]|nr:hypothetical protein [Magnetococcales bacterium]